MYILYILYIRIYVCIFFRRTHFTRRTLRFPSAAAPDQGSRVRLLEGLVRAVLRAGLVRADPPFSFMVVASFSLTSFVSSSAFSIDFFMFLMVLSAISVNLSRAAPTSTFFFSLSFCFFFSPSPSASSLRPSSPARCSWAALSPWPS